MRKLTEEEKVLVEENHNLIYWVANLKDLDIDEWYGLLAEELCITIQKHDPTKSKLSWFYKQRVDWRVHSEFEKTQAKKVLPMDLYADHEDYDTGIEDDEFDLIEFEPWLKTLSDEDREIVRLRYLGHTMREVADELGCSRGKVMWVMKRLRDEYEVYR